MIQEHSRDYHRLNEPTQPNGDFLVAGCSHRNPLRCFVLLIWLLLFLTSANTFKIMQFRHVTAVETHSISLSWQWCVIKHQKGQNSIMIKRSMKKKKTKGRKYCLTNLKQSPGGKHLVQSEQWSFQHSEGVLLERVKADHMGETETWKPKTRQWRVVLCKGISIFKEGRHLWSWNPDRSRNLRFLLSCVKPDLCRNTFSLSFQVKFTNHFIRVEEQSKVGPPGV